MHTDQPSLAGYALQSWLFARLIQVFQLNFWALMFFVLALAMATFYFILGVSSNTISMVSLPACCLSRHLLTNW